MPPALPWIAKAVNLLIGVSILIATHRWCWRHDPPDNERTPYD